MSKTSPVYHQLLLLVPPLHARTNHAPPPLTQSRCQTPYVSAPSSHCCYHRAEPNIPVNTPPQRAPPPQPPQPPALATTPPSAPQASTEACPSPPGSTESSPPPPSSTLPCQFNTQHQHYLEEALDPLKVKLTELASQISTLKTFILHRPCTTDENKAENPPESELNESEVSIEDFIDAGQSPVTENLNCNLPTSQQ